MQDTEWEILEVLWARNEATSAEVTSALEGSRGWAASTVRTMLGRMRDKGTVTARRVGKNWVYAPAFPRVDAQRTAWKAFASTTFQGVAGALRFLAKDAKLTKRQRAELVELLHGADGDE